MKRKDLMRIVIILLVLLVVLQTTNLLLNLYEDESKIIVREEFIGLNENDFIKAADRATPSVVFISTDNRSGSGVIIREDGIIVTNNHVVQDAGNISVRLPDNRIFRAVLIGGDPRADVAVLKIDANNLLALDFADSDKVEVGQPVIAIGNPYGYDFTVTTGIISAKHRDRGPTDYRDFLQTDASINPGNSGGPLVDLAGNIIGINTFIVSDERAGELGFSIPSNLVESITKQLLSSGKVERGFLGLRVRDVIDLDAEGSGRIIEGSLIDNLLEDGPSEESGLLPGDLIIEIEGRTIENSNSLRNIVASYRPGESVTVTVNRNETIIDFVVKLGIVPDN